MVSGRMNDDHSKTLETSKDYSHPFLLNIYSGAGQGSIWFSKTEGEAK